MLDFKSPCDFAVYFPKIALTTLCYYYVHAVVRGLLSMFESLSASSRDANSSDCTGGGGAMLGWGEGGRELRLLCGFNQYTLLQNRHSCVL